jgi:hypothetical protein
VQFAFLSMKNVGCAMYPWPFALNIAMDYLSAPVSREVPQEVAVHAIEVAWRSEVRTDCGFPTWQFGPWNRGKIY